MRCVARDYTGLILMTYQDCELLGLRPEHNRPEEYIWQYISVPPVCIRPSVAQDGASNEDDLTVKLTEIVFTNALLKQGIAKGVPTSQFMVRSPPVQKTMSSNWPAGAMGVLAAFRSYVHQLGNARRPFTNGPETHS